MLFEQLVCTPKPPFMPQVKPGIATTILAPDPVGEGFVEISPNKTLFIKKLTQDDPIRPQIVEDLQRVEDVFAHFNPNVDVELDKGRFYNGREF